MPGFHPDSIYCSSLLPVASLDAVLEDGTTTIDSYRDPGDSPDIAASKRQDAARLWRWAAALPADLAVVAQAILGGETQASLARRLKLTEAAISKRVRRLTERGRADLSELRTSLLLQ